MIDYKEFSDEELICRLRAGESAIEDYLLEKYKPFVKSKSRALFLVGGDKEDLIQEGMIGLFKAIRDYDPENGTPFAAFARLCVERQIYTAIEAAGRLKNAPLNGYISLSEESEHLPGYGMEEAVIERANYQQMYFEVQEHLSSMEKEVLELFLEGQDYRTIAKMLGKKDKSIDNTLQRIKSKIRKINLQKHLFGSIISK